MSGKLPPTETSEILADLEVLFYMEYLPFINEFFDPQIGDSEPAAQFEHFVLMSYEDDPEYTDPAKKIALLQQACTFLLRYDIIVQIFSRLLDKYRSLVQSDSLPESVTFFTYAIMQAQQFSQFSDDHGLVQYIEHLKFYIKNLRPADRATLANSSIVDQVKYNRELMQGILDAQKGKHNTRGASGVKRMLVFEEPAELRGMIEYAEYALRLFTKYLRSMPSPDPNVARPRRRSI